MSLFTRWFGAKKNVNSGKAVKPRARLNVEALEQRNLAAVDAFIWFQPATTMAEPVGDAVTQKVVDPEWLSVAGGDVNGDRIDDVIVGAGPGAPGGHVKVFDGNTGALIRSFMAYDAGYLGGVSVAAGDVNGDGFDDIITGAATNGHVKAFSGADGSLLASFYAFPGFSGGVRVAGGDVDCDGSVDIIAGAETDAATGHVKVFDGMTGAEMPAFEIKDFSFGVENPTTIGSATGGAGAGKIKFNEFTIKKTSDKASPAMFEWTSETLDAEAAGARISKMVIDSSDPSTAGKEFLRFKFDTVFTTNIDWSGPGDEGPEESITFVYGKLGVDVDPSDPSLVDR